MERVGMSGQLRLRERLAWCSMRMRRGIQDLVREFNVQVVFSGHDHNYERILPAHDGEVTLQKEVRHQPGISPVLLHMPGFT